MESNEEITVTLQHTITQRDREITELREMLATRDCAESLSYWRGGHTVQASPKRFSMSWEILPFAFVTALVVVDDKVYFDFGGYISEEIYTSGHQNKLSTPTVKDFISIVNIYK